MNIFLVFINIHRLPAKSSQKKVGISLQQIIQAGEILAAFKFAKICFIYN
jgi:hypothetical protein